MNHRSRIVFIALALASSAIGADLAAASPAPEYRATFRAIPRYGEIEDSELSVTDGKDLRMDGTALPPFFWVSRRDSLVEWMRLASPAPTARGCHLGEYRLTLRKGGETPLVESGCLESARGKRLLKARRRLSPWR